MGKQKLVGTEAGIREVKVGRSYVILEEYDKNYYKVEHNFKYEDGKIKKTKDYVRIVNNLISLTKFPRGKIEKAIETGYLKIRNQISNETLRYIGDFISEWNEDNKTTYRNIEKLEKIDKTECIFIHSDLSLNYYAVEYNKLRHKLYSYGKKHLFINGFTPVDDYMHIIDDIYQNSVLLALELNKPIENVFYRLFQREMRFLQKAEKRFRYLSEMIEKESKEQETLEENGFIEVNEDLAE